MTPPDNHPEVQITFEGETVIARPGDSVAAALWNAGRVRLRSSVSGEPRSWFCAMGSCWECLLLIDGRPRRSCVTACVAGMEIRRIEPSDPGEVEGG